MDRGEAPDGGALLGYPTGLTLTDGGLVIFADAANNAVRQYGNGAVSTLVGNGTQGLVNGTRGRSGTTELGRPTGVVWVPGTAGAWTLFITDGANNLIRAFDSAGVTRTFSGTGVAGFTDGPPDTAQFSDPEGIVADSAGNLFVADYSNNAIRQIDPAGNVTTIAGNGTDGEVDGAGGRSGVAEFAPPAGMPIDAHGDLYVGDHQGNVIRKIAR